MVHVKLSWSPTFEVGQRHSLDSLSTTIVLPTCPLVGQAIHISDWIVGDDKKAERTADYFKFQVKGMEYYIERPGQPVEIVLYLELEKTARHSEDDACDVLQQVFGWEKIE